MFVALTRLLVDRQSLLLVKTNFKLKEEDYIVDHNRDIAELVYNQFWAIVPISKESRAEMTLVKLIDRSLTAVMH